MNKNIDYLYELGKNDTGNTNTNVGAKEGKIDDIFARNRGDGEFKLGADSDIANGDLRFRFQEVRQFNNLVGDYYRSRTVHRKSSFTRVQKFHVRRATE